MVKTHNHSVPILLIGRRRTLAHALWWVVLVVTMVVWIGAFLNDYQVYLNTELTLTQIELLQRMEISYQSVPLYISSFKALSMGVYILIASLIFWRRQNEWHTILISVTLILTGSVVTWVFPTLTTDEPFLYTMSNLITILGWFAFGLQFIIFPDGRIVPKWARWFLVIYFFILLIANFLVDNPLRSEPSSFGQVIILGLFMVLGIYAQIYRYFRESTRVQRLQTKWVVYAFLLTGLLLQLIDTMPLLIPDIRDPNTSQGAFYVLFIEDLQYRIVYLLIPVALGVAILQYRLFDIDVIIRRTLVYTILTLLLGLIYFGGVTLIQRLFSGVTGQGSPIAIVISTLLIAGLFTPVRTRVQDFIDKRFYRARYDGERSLARFSTAARDELEIESLAGELIDVVQETMQPEHVELQIINVANQDR
jgi:hypothetical protein